jgi:membrane protein YqaA with SNARE-associated domain
MYKNGRKDEGKPIKEKSPLLQGGLSNQKAVLKKVCYAYINNILGAFVTLYLNYFYTDFLKDKFRICKTAFYD